MCMVGGKSVRDMISLSWHEKFSKAYSMLTEPTTTKPAQVIRITNTSTSQTKSLMLAITNTFHDSPLHQLP